MKDELHRYDMRAYRDGRERVARRQVAACAKGRDLFLAVVRRETVKAHDARRECDAVLEAHDGRQYADHELLDEERCLLRVHLEELALDVGLGEATQVLPASQIQNRR